MSLRKRESSASRFGVVSTGLFLAWARKAISSEHSRLSALRSHPRKILSGLFAGEDASTLLFTFYLSHSFLHSQLHHVRPICHEPHSRISHLAPASNHCPLHLQLQACSRHDHPLPPTLGPTEPESLLWHQLLVVLVLVTLTLLAVVRKFGGRIGIVDKQSHCTNPHGSKEAAPCRGNIGILYACQWAQRWRHDRQGRGCYGYGDAEVAASACSRGSDSHGQVKIAGRH
ncbi:MAG: hypothetical protein J3Q66DRAFT_360613 [Benniella sp.]|nr:MAG: hypothetical protein J3Q66DRAFT_360613 [Benniella sp.]